MKKLVFLIVLSLMMGLAWGQGFENFDNCTVGTSYVNGSFVGNNGITWSYVASRDGNNDSNGSGIDLPALMLRRLSDNSNVTSSAISGGISGFSVKLYKGFTGSGNRQVELFVNGVSKGTSTVFDDYSEHIFEVNNINIAGDIVIKVANNTSTQVIIDDITWTGYSASVPTVNVTPSSLSGFTYVLGSGPSNTQTFTVSGTNLTANISVSAPANYEISLSSGSGYTSPITLTQSGGNVATTTIYARLKAGLSVGDYNNEDITASSSGATNKTVTCSGSVTSPPPPDAPGATAATNVGNTGFTANWGAVSGATGYRLDVYSGTISELVSTGFEDGGSAPANWTQNLMSFTSGAAIAHSGTYYAGMNAIDDWLQTPQLSSPVLITFWAKTSSANVNRIKVQYSSDSTNWNDLAEYIQNASDNGDITTTWAQKSINANLSGSYYIR